MNEDHFNNSFFTKLAQIFNKYETAEDSTEDGIDLTNQSVIEILEDLEPEEEKKVEFKPIINRRRGVVCDMKGWLSEKKSKSKENKNKIQTKIELPQAKRKKVAQKKKISKSISESTVESTERNSCSGEFEQEDDILFRNRRIRHVPKVFYENEFEELYKANCDPINEFNRIMRDL